VGLCADTIDEFAVGVDALHQFDDTLDLGVVRVEVVVVNVELHFHQLHNPKLNRNSNTLTLGSTARAAWKAMVKTLFPSTRDILVHIKDDALMSNTLSPVCALDCSVFVLQRN
jgi:hypothetical protein